MALSSRSALVSGILAAAFVPGLGAQAALVADLGSAIPYTRQEHFSGLALSATLDGIGYFLYDDGVHGRELWRSDGSLVGTYLVLDACPGECGAAWSFAWDALVATSEAVYFAASDGVHGEEIWKSDGTAAGTRMVRDIAAGLRSGAPTTLRRVGERVFFTAVDDVTGRELWVTDGTEAGTQQVSELEPGSAGIHLNSAKGLGDVLLFGFDSSKSAGLWRSDGTAAGTYQLSSVEPWQQNWTANSAFEVIGGRLVFRGDDADSNYDPTLWVSDGTPGGTQELSSIAEPSLFVRVRERIYFSSPGPGGGLYRTDGTPLGTFQIPLPKGTSVSGNYGFAGAAGANAFFAASDGSTGRELWATNGDAAWFVADIWPGPESGLAAVFGPFSSLHVPGITGFGDRVVFYADDGVHGRELWASDGTPSGTTLLLDLTTGPAPTLSDGVTSYVVPPTVDAGVFLRPVSGDGARELWRSDGTAAGTALVSTIRAQTSGFLPFAAGTIVFANPHLRRCFVPLGDGVLFSIRGAGDRWELWFASGAPPSAQPVETLAPDPELDQAPYCRPFGGEAVLEANVPAHGGAGLFKASGGLGLEPVVLGNRPGAWLDADAVEDQALYLGGTGGVWRTDGTAANTFVYPTPVSDGPAELERLGERILVAGSQLFVTSKDGSALEPIAINGENFSWPLKLAAAGARAYLLAWTDAEGMELWATDGTQEGTSIVRDIRPGVESAFHEEAPGEGRSTLSSIVALGTLAVFAADDGVHGEELWVTDGTADGTVLLADLVPGSYPSSPRELTRVGARAYFVAESPGTGRELWRTDGTAVGTELVADVVAGPGSSIPQELTAQGSELYFSAWTPGAGREPWRLRENAAPAPLLAPLADVAPGPLSSSPLAFLEVGGRVFFPANDNSLGFELWSVQEPDSVFSDGFESSGTAVWSGSIP